MSDRAHLDPSRTADSTRTVVAEGVHGQASSAPMSGYGSNILGDTEVHLLDYVKVLYKRRWTVITVFLIVLLSISVYTFTATPIYEARVQILIEKEASNVVTFKEAIEQNQVTDDYYQTQYKILQSRALARRTIEALKLWDNPRFNPKTGDGLTVGKIVMAPFTFVADLFRSPSRPTDTPQSEESAAQSRTVDRFLNDLIVSPIRNSRLVDVRFQSPDAAMSAVVYGPAGVGDSPTPRLSKVTTR